MFRATSLLVVLCLLLTSNVHAQLIDFETTPAGGIPVDNAPNAAPYNLTGGGTVSMFFDVNANNTFDSGDAYSLFEATGQDGTDGFVNSISGINDDPAPGYAAQLGNFFVRQPVSGTIPPPFIIQYNTTQTITALAGEIWDVDGTPAATEQWRVEVLNAGNVTLASQLSPLGNSGALDSKPWTFAFTGLPLGVDKVRMTFVGSKTQGLGLAFNNFQPTTAPEPTSAAILLGATCVGARRRRAGRCTRPARQFRR